MQAEQIVSEVKRYIEDKSYNYAILIDGEWGSGKTYFVEKTLTPIIESIVDDTKTNTRKGISNYSVEYVSLYGCKGVEDIKETIAWDFLGRPKNKKVKKDYLRKKVIPIFSSSKRIVNGLLDKYFSKNDTYDALAELMISESFVFVFDDLERCDCPINEIFGFINELVEHRGKKVIVVANEKEIIGEKNDIEDSGQYVLALDEKILWPHYERNNSIFSYNIPKDKISIDELVFRKNILFPSEEECEEYKRIREKLIGVTLKYTPDMDSIVKNLVNQCQEKDVRECIIRNTSAIESTMKLYKHHNLRTVQFYISKLTYLFREANGIDISMDYRERVLDYLAKETFSCAVKYKGNYREPELVSDLQQNTNDIASKCIKNYVEKGEFNREDFAKDIDRVINQVLKNTIEDEDPYNQLYNNIYYMTQEECVKKLQLMIERLRKNMYPLFSYEKMLILTARLDDFGFPKNYSENIVSAMIANINATNEISEFSVDLFYIDNSFVRENVKRKVAEINDAIKNHTKEYCQSSLEEMLKKENWVDELTKFTESRGLKNDYEEEIFCKVSASIWVDAITKLSADKIHEFRFWMFDVYPNGSPRKRFEKDWPTMLEIYRSINPSIEEDLIKRKALEYVQWNISETYITNTGKEFVLSQFDDNI